MTSDAPDDGTPLILVNPRAARLTDRLQRDRVVADVSTAVRRRYGRAPRIEAGSLEAARAALAESLDAPLVVVVGGDGSVREAAEALIGQGTPLAIVPGGTGNVLAGALGIRGVGPGVAAIRAGRTRVLDLGRARWGTGTSDPDGAEESEERLFTVACGMGLDARIMAAAADEWKRRMRFGAYVGAALRELVRLESARFRIVADGDVIELQAYLALVANAGELIPGRVGPRQPIDPTDGLLDLIVLGGGPLTAMHGAVELMVRTGHLQGAVVRRAVREVRIEADPLQPIETDGDAQPSGWLEARVVPAGLTVVAPS